MACMELDIVHVSHTVHRLFWQRVETELFEIEIGPLQASRALLVVVDVELHDKNYGAGPLGV
jgi:hypothetical protein